jgi:hypothetical protein
LGVDIGKGKLMAELTIEQAVQLGIQLHQSGKIEEAAGMSIGLTKLRISRRWRG